MTPGSLRKKYAGIVHPPNMVRLPINSTTSGDHRKPVLHVNPRSPKRLRHRIAGSGRRVVSGLRTSRRVGNVYPIPLGRFRRVLSSAALPGLHRAAIVSEIRGKPEERELTVLLHQTKEDIPKNGIAFKSPGAIEAVGDEWVWAEAKCSVAAWGPSR